MARQSGGALIGVTIVVLLGLAAPAETSVRGSPSHDWAYAVAIVKGGKLVAAGQSLTQRSRRFALARYTASGKLDATFGRAGKVVTAGDVYRDITPAHAGAPAAAVGVQADGKIVAVGGALFRYTARGALDPGFGSGGKVLRQGSTVAIDAGGKILVVGEDPTSHRSTLARFTPRGRLDPTFGRGGEVTIAFGAALAMQADGKIVVGGTNGNVGFGLARFHRDGASDSSFGNGGKVVIGFGKYSSPALWALAIQPDGKIVAAGEADLGEGDPNEDFVLARFTADGRLDPAFGDGGKVATDFSSAAGCCPWSNDAAHALVVQPDGKIVTVGESDGGAHSDQDHSIFKFALARYNDDGSLDTSFGRGGTVQTKFARRPSTEASSSIAEAVVIQRDGKIVVAGLGNGYDFALARYTTGGRLDRSFGSGGKVLTDFGSG
jgi:uncharacterized delta-60 repeat protein